MKRILVATDFSTRSDRAMQRATLLGREFDAELVLVTVVDDDQPRRLRELEVREATALLQDLARTARENMSVSCEARVELGEPFRRIVDAADDCDADVVLMGPHRRNVLRNIFVGTTAERTIRHSRRPVLMANAAAARRYDRIVIATDFSGGSAHAAEAVRRLGLLASANVVVAHGFEALLEGPIVGSSMNMREHQDFMARERKSAEQAMAAFLRQAGLETTRHAVEVIEHSAAQTILDVARREQANLIVVGTHGKSGAEHFLLGSVAQGVFRQEGIDVLAVPTVARAPSTLEG